ncbi:glycerol-3-phosphate ABC transporter substrate-binding protein, partial [Pseudomonas sp. MWU12-2312b]
MTDTHRLPSPSPAQDSADAMDQALDWLIVLDDPSEEQTRQFHQWLAADPAHADAFAKVQAIWNGQPVTQCAQSLATPLAKVTVISRLRPH